MNETRSDGAPRKGLKRLVEDYERTLILQALAASQGHQRRAAAALGVLPTTLVEKMKRLGLPGANAARRLEPTNPVLMSEGLQRAR